VTGIRNRTRDLIFPGILQEKGRNFFGKSQQAEKSRSNLPFRFLNISLLPLLAGSGGYLCCKSCANFQAMPTNNNGVCVEK
jgi:hypothetical protein